jgi:hypothetical protein
VKAQLDHLVVVAHTLAQGVAWCEATLGLTPGPGGRHALMGTHNRLFKIASERFPRAYFEIIAIDPEAPAPGRARWFGMDDERLREAVRREPRLVHFVVSTADIDAARAALLAQGMEPGVPTAAARDTPRGRLQWQITVRDDGMPQRHGALPTLIEWGAVHPADAMPESGATLHAMAVNCETPSVLQAACASIGLEQVDVTSGVPALRAVLHTPRGLVSLQGGF